MHVHKARPVGHHKCFSIPKTNKYLGQKYFMKQEMTLVRSAEVRSDAILSSLNFDP